MSESTRRVASDFLQQAHRRYRCLFATIPRANSRETTFRNDMTPPKSRNAALRKSLEVHARLLNGLILHMSERINKSVLEAGQLLSNMTDLHQKHWPSTVGILAHELCTRYGQICASTVFTPPATISGQTPSSRWNYARICAHGEALMGASQQATQWSNQCELYLRRYTAWAEECRNLLLCQSSSSHS